MLSSEKFQRLVRGCKTTGTQADHALHGFAMCAGGAAPQEYNKPDGASAARNPGAAALFNGWMQRPKSITPAHLVLGCGVNALVHSTGWWVVGRIE